MRFYKFCIVFILLGCTSYYIYQTNIVESYSYLGYNYVYSLEKIITSIILFIIFLIILKKIYVKSSFIFSLLSVFFVFSTIPTLVYYSSSEALYLPLIGHITFFTFNLFFSSQKLKIRTYQLNNNQFKFVIYSFFLFGVLLFVSTFKNNFDIGISIDDVYDVRDRYNSGGNLMTRYLYSSFANIFCPFLILYGLYTKNKILSIGSLVFCIYLGLISGLKTTFFNLIIIYLIFYFKGNLKVKIFKLLSLLLIGMFFAIYLNIDTPLNLVNDVLVRRSMFTNPIVTNGYFEVFNDNMMLLSHSVFKSISGFNEIYPTFQVGSHLFNDSSINANTGFIADGYMNFGIFGMILYTLLMTLIILYINSLKVVDEYLGIYLVMIYSCIEMEFTVMLLTHGLFFLLLISTFIFQKKQYE
jgi:oligosaccharide repeat unit polymerase